MKNYQKTLTLIKLLVEELENELESENALEEKSQDTLKIMQTMKKTRRKK